MATLMEKDVLIEARASSFSDVANYKIKIEKTRELTEEEEKEISEDYDKLSGYKDYIYSTSEEKLDFKKLVKEILEIGRKYDKK